MASGGSSGKDADMMKCPLCLGPYNTPKFLPCFHSFCAPCLTAYIDVKGHHGKILCPSCRKEARVPPDGVDGFQTNYYIPVATEMKPCEGQVPNGANRGQNQCKEKFMQCVQSVKSVLGSPVGSPRISQKLGVRGTGSPNRAAETQRLTEEVNTVRKDLTDLLKTKSSSRQEQMSWITQSLRTFNNRIKTEEEKALRSLSEQHHKIRVAAKSAFDKETRSIKEHCQGLRDVNNEKMKAWKQQVEVARGLEETAEFILQGDSDYEFVKNGKAIVEQLKTEQICSYPEFKDGLSSGIFVTGSIDEECLQKMLGSVLVEDNKQTSETRRSGSFHRRQLSA